MLNIINAHALLLRASKNFSWASKFSTYWPGLASNFLSLNHTLPEEGCLDSQSELGKPVENSISGRYQEICIKSTQESRNE